jgi:uncharacterized membrane protein YoaK (UPF0700 family)
MRNFGSRQAGSLGSCTAQKSSKRAELVLPSVNRSLAAKWLPFALSIVAGSVDVIGFLALNGLFTAHITGNIASFLAVGIADSPSMDPNTADMVCAGMLGVAAMAVQNALVRISLTGAPSTAVMTTNVTVFAMDIGEVLLAPDESRVAKARERARSTGTAIAGFLVGCALGAAGEHVFGLRSLAVPIAFGSLALLLGVAANPSQSRS